MGLEYNTMMALTALPPKGLAGRRKIKSPVKRVTEQNLLDVLNTALATHAENVQEISYLYDYYKGIQDVRNKKKVVRENINQRVCVNRANEIVTFKSSFLLEEPIQYIAHNGDDAISKLVNALNEMMREADKEANDKSIVDWMHICGVAERLVIRNEDRSAKVPFEIFTIDPREAFVIYNNGIGEKPLAGVILGVTEDEKLKADVYTPSMHYVVYDDGKVTTVTAPQYDGIPLVEYLNNEARMGAFEPVISILNGINQLESNALDSVEDFVNGFDVFQNCDVADGDYSGLSIGGKAVKIKTVTPGMEAKVYRVSSEISQQGVQTRVDDLTSAYLEICGMPNRNGGSSTSDTGAATIFRDGWATAVSRAKETETMFRRSERKFCQIALTICKTQGVAVPSLSDFECEFLAHKLSNLQSKVQSLCQMLENPKIHPKHAYAAAGVFEDNETAYRDGMAWCEENERKKEESLNNALDDERERLRLKSRTSSKVRDGE